MSDSLNPDAFLSQAVEREKQYDWLEAAQSYRKALGLVPKSDFSRASEIHERLSYALYRSAFQTEDLKEFRNRMAEALADYEETKKSCEKTSNAAKAP